MKYMCLIYADESVPQGDPEALGKAYFAFSEEAVAAGKFVAGDPLEATSTATTVRIREGQTLTTDGPFAETKEQLGGYYVLDCEDLDEALAWAAKIPTAPFGSIEVRPVSNLM